MSSITSLSIIVPTFGRAATVVTACIQSIYDDYEHSKIKLPLEVLLVDQNETPLTFSSEAKKNWKSFIHLTGLHPSVTKAKNRAAKEAKGDLLFFFDDDVVLHKGNIQRQLELHNERDDLGMLGGREVYPETKEYFQLEQKERRKRRFVSFLKWIVRSFFSQNVERERSFKNIDDYIGRIYPETSFFFCRFDSFTARPIKVDTVRGCNASVKKEAFEKVSGFDESFQGSAIREESDFSLRLQQAGKVNYYAGDFAVTHHRQLGGCNNLAKNYATLISKLENELHFQQRHFSHVSRFYFFIRLFPYVLSYAKSTAGISFFLVLQFTLLLKKSR